MKILICVQDYPTNEGTVSLMYIHTRSIYYKKAGLEVTVLNFSSNIDYMIDDIPVISLYSYKKNLLNKYDILILHAANLKNHYRFLIKYGNRFPRFIFFYHGHEVMYINRDYASPYYYIKKNRIKNIFQDIYDRFKLFVWRKFLVKNMHKSELIFVSKWMYDIFLKNIALPKDIIKSHSYITYNSVATIFEEETYQSQEEKKYDFVTIRSWIDGSKYAVDLVNSWAKNSPESCFLLIGKGHFFEHFEKAPNLDWVDQTMSHTKIIEILQNARFALMPTRTDAQGLMMCEMAAFGIPVITSDIPVCHEVFDGFSNVFFLNNSDIGISLDSFKKLPILCKKDDRYSSKNTTKKEIEIIKRNLLK